MSLKKYASIVVAGLVCVAFAAPAFAEDPMMLHGDDAIAKRKELMRADGGLLKAAGGKTAADAVADMEALVANLTTIGTLFPEDSQAGDTHAKPAIWTDSVDFQMKYSAALAAANALLVAAQAGDDAAFKGGFKAMGDSCGGCHMLYRAH